MERVAATDDDDNTGDDRIFVLERGTESIVRLVDSDGDGIPDTTEFVVYAPGLNHGLEVYDGCLYASSDTTVYRWPLYDDPSSDDDDDDEINTPLRYPLSQESTQVLVVNIDADGNGGAPRGHTTRTLLVDTDNDDLYISVGSNQNVDADSYRSRIRRLDLSSMPCRTTSNTTTDTIDAVDFADLPVVVDGLRNTVGMAFDEDGILWGVENSADNLMRDDLGGDIHNDNPADELNRIDVAAANTAGAPPKHYGYPYCWTEYSLPENVGTGRGSVWAWPSFLGDSVVLETGHDSAVAGSTAVATTAETIYLTDTACSDPGVFVPPALALQAHSAPLGITFFHWEDHHHHNRDDDDRTNRRLCEGVSSFPQSMDGYAFLAYHGSWNRDVPTGYKVVVVPMDSGNNGGDDGDASPGSPIDLLAHQPPDAKWQDGFRPVDVAFDTCGRLIVTSDGTRGRGSKIVRIEYRGAGETVVSAAAAFPGGGGAAILWYLSLWLLFWRTG